jgi:tetratricopeptide (TPR) repeat protein
LIAVRRIIVLTLLVIVAPWFGLGATPAEDFQRANQLYEEREFEEAIKLYRQVLDQNLQSAHLYYNLGNAYFKSGDLGHAVLNYLRAKRMAPGDDDINQNLRFASSFTRIQMEGVRLNPIRSLFESILEPYHVNLLAWISSFFFVLLFVLLAVRYGLGIRNGLLKAGIITTLVLVICPSLLTTFKYHNDYLIERAVLVAEDCPVRTGPSDQSDVELQAAPGLVVEVVDESGDWFNVLFANKRRGWIKKDLVAVV